MSSVIKYIQQERGNKTKHNQIVDGIMSAISDKVVKKGDVLPSVNTLIGKLSVARMTAVRALEGLKERGIIESENRVGYFVKSDNVKQELKVMLFLTEFNVYHEVLYNELKDQLNDMQISIDLFFHHCNPGVFRSIIKDNLGLYGLYIVTGFDHPEVKKSLKLIPSRKLLQLARPSVLETSSFVSQDFYNEVVEALRSITNKILCYRKFVLIFNAKGRHPKMIRKAFEDYCLQVELQHEIIDQLTNQKIAKNTAYLVIDDYDLIELVKASEAKGFQLGKDVGVLSYNDTPMKEIIRNGISVISSDFSQMGKLAADFIKTQKPVRATIPTKIILRNSL